MTLETCKRMLEHFESKGMKKQAEDMKNNILFREWSLNNPKVKAEHFKVEKSESPKKAKK